MSENLDLKVPCGVPMTGRLSCIWIAILLLISIMSNQSIICDRCKLSLWSDVNSSLPLNIYRNTGAPWGRIMLVSQFFSSCLTQSTSFLLRRSRESSTCSSTASNSTNFATSWSPVRTEPNANRRITTTATDATAHSDMAGKTAKPRWVSSYCCLLYTSSAAREPWTPDRTNLHNNCEESSGVR